MGSWAPKAALGGFGGAEGRVQALSDVSSTQGHCDRPAGLGTQLGHRAAPLPPSRLRLPPRQWGALLWPGGGQAGGAGLGAPAPEGPLLCLSSCPLTHHMSPVHRSPRSGVPLPVEPRFLFSFSDSVLRASWSGGWRTGCMGPAGGAGGSDSLGPLATPRRPCRGPPAVSGRLLAGEHRVTLTAPLSPSQLRAR